jgi:citrate lyase beta subunit
VTGPLRPSFPELAIGICKRRAMRKPDLPLRYWAQQAHLTTPANDLAMANKALTASTAAARRALEQLDLRPIDLADRLEVHVALVEARLAQTRPAPLVMLDGEDSIAPGPEAVSSAVAITSSVLAAEAASGAQRGLRFFRPPGLGHPAAAAAVVQLLDDLVARAGVRIPLDGLVIPKAEDADDIAWFDDILKDAESRLALEPGAIRLAILIEGGSAVHRVWEIAERAGPRLSSLVFGIADYAADLGLGAIDQRHPMVEWARHEIVACAGAFGVPSIDGMTLRYPVIDRAASASDARKGWLDAMALAYRDASHANAIGMHGKWVGHPAQLLPVMLAFETDIDQDRQAIELASVEAYARAVAGGSGAVMIEGMMADRATDRQIRTKLRRDVAFGRLDPARALAIGLIDAGEHDAIVDSLGTPSEDLR